MRRAAAISLMHEEEEMRRRSVARLATAGVLALGAATLAVSSAGAVPAQERSSESAPVGLTLEKNRQTIKSALRVDLTRDFATLPLHKGTANGETVWFVITDVSDASMAQRLGLNHAPKLLNAPRDCPACVQEVATDDSVLGRAPVQFQGAPDFSHTRTLTPAPKPATFPPLSFTVGAQAGAGYSPYVRVAGSDVVFNAPIVATGDGPFDVTTHTNTHDRTLGIDTEKMTTDHLFVRGFSNGRSIAYLSFDSSDAFTATVERSTFVPALADLQFQNGGDGPGRDDRSDSARASIFTFVNAQTGLEAPSERGASQGEGRSQGLTHALSLPIVGQDAAVENPEVLDALARGADVSNIFSDMPRDFGNSDASEYSPAWDLQVGVYSDAAVAAGQNGLQTDADEVALLATSGVVTAPGGLPMGSANIIINCPALAFLDGTAQDPTSGPDAGGGGTATQAASLAGAPVITGSVGAGQHGGGVSPLLTGSAGVLGVGLAFLGLVLLRRGRVNRAA
ncbi:MAG: hypothetical protein H0W56_06475 [Acidothermales bacterium]|nr:hypothetical protein [Acidothermales bacterium]